ncbi:hypothetical protein ACLESD_41555 [Pyxidicoccus sp. 3LFB2]
MYRFVMMGALLLAAVGCGSSEQMGAEEAQAPVEVSSSLEAAAEVEGSAALTCCGTCESQRRSCVTNCGPDFDCRALCMDNYESCVYFTCGGTC